MQYTSDQNGQSIISDLQAVIQNLQQDTRGFLIGPSFTSPSLLLCPISQIQYWPNWTTSSLWQITMSPGLCSTPPIRMLFPTQFTRQTFTCFQDAAQGWLFWSLSWTWEVALMPLSPLCYYNNAILLCFSTCFSSLHICFYGCLPLLTINFSKVWTCPAHFCMPASSTSRRKMNVEDKVQRWRKKS